jgi:hypothetical protein
MAYTPEQKAKWRQRPEVQARQASYKADWDRTSRAARTEYQRRYRRGKPVVDQQQHTPHQQQQLVRAICLMRTLPDMPVGPSFTSGGYRVPPGRLIKIYGQKILGAATT